MSGSGTALVIGASGFIGRYVVAELARRGLEVHGFDVGESRPCTAMAALHAGSVTDRLRLEQVCARIQPRVVISLAAFTGDGMGPGVSAERDCDAAFAVNVDGLRNTIAACRSAAVERFVWTSSTTVLGPAVDGVGLADEEARRSPVTTYGLTKSLAEEIGVFAHRRCGLDVVALRPTLVLGPRHPYRGMLDPLKQLFAACANGHPYVKVSWSMKPFDIVHVDDVAAAVSALALAAGPLQSLYHVNGGPIDIRRIAEIAGAISPRLDIEIVESAQASVYPLVCARRLTDDVGFTPIYAPDEIIRDCISSITIEGTRRCLTSSN